MERMDDALERDDTPATVGTGLPQHSHHEEAAPEKASGAPARSLSSLKQFLGEQRLLAEIASIRRRSFRTIGRFIDRFVSRWRTEAGNGAEESPAAPKWEERQPHGTHYGETREPHKRRGPPLVPMTIRQNPLHMDLSLDGS